MPIQKSYYLKYVLAFFMLFTLFNNSTFAQNKKIIMSGDSVRAVRFNNNKYGFIATNGEIIIDSIYDYAREFNNGYALVHLKEKYFFIDINNKKLLNKEYDQGNDFSEGFSCVGIKDSTSPSNFKYGFINTRGELIQNYVYPYTFSFNNGKALVTINKNKQFYIDSIGKIIKEIDSINPTYYVTGNITISQKNNNCYITNIFGDTVYTSISQNIYNAFSIKEKQNYIRLENKSKWGIIDTTGKVIVPFIYDYISDFSSGIALVKKNNLYGYINIKGEIILKINLKYAEEFSEGLAMIKLNNNDKVVFINSKGKVIISNTQSFPETKFKKGLITVLGFDGKNLKPGFINKQGKLIFP